MHLIRQFAESLALGLGVGLALVVCALYILEWMGPADLDPINGPRAVSTPITQPVIQRDENGVPLGPDARPGSKDARPGETKRVG